MNVQLVRVIVNTNFGSYTAGDELLLENNKETRQLVKNGYLDEIAVEITPSPKPSKKEDAPVVKKPVGKAKTKKES